MSESSGKLDLFWEKQIVEGVEVSLPKVNLHPLQSFEKLRSELLDVDQRNGPLFMRDLNYAYEAVSKLASKVFQQLSNAEVEAKHQKAKAILERATEYIKEKGLKDSAGLREYYGDLDIEYRIAKEKVHALRALYEILNTKAESFRMAHDDAKKVYDKITSGPSGPKL